MTKIKEAPFTLIIKDLDQVVGPSCDLMRPFKKLNSLMKESFLNFFPSFLSLLALIITTFDFIYFCGY